MCGIAGIISRDTSLINSDILTRMGDCMSHRGPDGQAFWINNANTTGFSHRRLSVIDLSVAAAQPMHYAGRYTIVYNGEIYNYIEVREQLIKKGHRFNTSSDTEVILSAYAEHREECVDYFDGMFAFAIWDDIEKTLFCARDRFGEKPFHYCLTGNKFSFASEIKSLEKAGVSNEKDSGMILQFLITGNTIDAMDNSRTFYKHVKRLPPAHILTYDLMTGGVITRRYWSLSKKINRINLSDAHQQLNELLTMSVKRRLRSDVPIGTSLSGGLDSSSIIALLDTLGVKELKTFTATFPGFAKDEADKAANTSKRFGFENVAVAPTGRGLANDFSRLASHHDEPVASASVYAQFKVFELAAANNTTVLLDGQGADETLGGYDHYRTWGIRSMMPQLTARILQRKEEARVNKYQYLDKDFLERGKPGYVTEKPVVRQLNDWLFFDTICLGLQQLLSYADRNSMAHGREVRLPFLSHQLVSFVFSLPSSFKIKDGYTKWILRKLMQDKLPGDVVWTKRKTGFEPPQKKWMEEEQMQHYIMEQLQWLVQEKVLNSLVLDQRSSVHDAFDRQGNLWRWTALGAFLNKKGSE